MKQTILILSILTFVRCFGQKWHLNNVNEKEAYPYEYWFQYENKEDTCTYQQINNIESQNSVIKLLDNKGDTVIFANIKLINLDTDTETNLISDYNGKSEFRLENGKYRIKISAMNYDNFNLEFEIENGQQMELNITLGLAPELTVYQIDSKKELTENEILEIIDCVRVNRNDFYNYCSDLKKYQIVMHI